VDQWRNDWSRLGECADNLWPCLWDFLSGAPPYNDSTAILAGTWASNQTAQGTVHAVNQSSAFQEEVELRLRTTITPHSITGYEFDYRVTSDGSQYIVIVRWNGPQNSFCYLYSGGCTTDPSLATIKGPGLHNGDVVMATAVGNTLSLYINGVRYLQVTDSTYTSGSPGIGFWNLAARWPTTVIFFEFYCIRYVRLPGVGSRQYS
jgi:hypothetical protein